MWCIPPKQNAEFVARMEDILSVYARPYSEDYPVVCMDEKPYQFLDDQYPIIPMGQNNHTVKQDCEYKRNGTCSIFIFTEALSGWRNATAEPRRTSIDWAHKIKWLLAQYPKAKKLILVLDNLNTHSKASLYKAFPPEEAFELASRLEIHYTPKHGSWLNIAEIELSALSIQCLGDKRIPSIEILNEELEAWHTSRNANQKGVDWQFKTDDARIKLKHLYPTIEM